jgi:hypothetical protein
MARRVAEVVDLDHGFNAILENLEETAKRQILIGIQEGSKTHLDAKKERIREPGISIAQYAAANEFGTDNIPERSFVRSTFDQRLNDIMEITIGQLGLVIDREISLDVAYNRIGLAVTGMVQQKIREIRSPPNSPITIEKKGSSKPLIDFGQMIAAVRHVVKKERASL